VVAVAGDGQTANLPTSDLRVDSGQRTDDHGGDGSVGKSEIQNQLSN